MVGRTAGEVRLLEGQMVNSRVLEVTIYARAYLRAPFRRCSKSSLHVHFALVLYEQTRITATRLDWTAVVLNSSETS